MSDVGLMVFLHLVVLLGFLVVVVILHPGNSKRRNYIDSDEEKHP